MYPYCVIICNPQGLHLNKHESPSPQDASCQIPKYSGQWFKIFKYFVIILPFLPLK